MTTGYRIGGSVYRNRIEAITGEIGKWTPEPIVDVEAAVAGLLAMEWFDESLGEVEAGEIRDGIEALNDFLREAAAAETSTFALVDLGDEGTGTIAEVHELTDRQRDEMDKEHGRRLVHLPGGGEVGDWVTIDEDGVAEVVA